MPNDTYDDIRTLLFESTSDLPALAPAPDRTLRRARRRMIRTVSIGTLVAGLVLGGILSIANPFTRSLPAKTPHVKNGTWVVNIDTGSSSRFEGLPRGAFWFDASRDGSLVAFNANVHGRSQVFLMDPAGTGLRPVTHDRYEASQPALSPDASMLAYRGFGRGDVRNIFVKDLTGGGVEQITHERHDVSELEWSPDGQRILYSVSIQGPNSAKVFDTGASSELKVVEVHAGVAKRVAGNHHSPADFGTWSPDGSQIAYMTGHEWTNNNYGFEPAEVWVMNADGTDPHRLSTLPGRCISLKWAPTGSEIAFSAPDGDGFSTYVLDANTHEVRKVASGFVPVWLTDHELIVHIGG